MQHFHQALLKLTTLYVAILMVLALACSIWLYSIAGKEITFVAQRLPSSGTASGDLSEFQDSHERLLQSLVFFNLFIFGAGTLASYALAKRTLRPIQQSYQSQAQFAAEASHQLRTPLTALKAELQLARKGELTTKEYKAAIHSSLEEVERLSMLTKRLLSLTTAKPGQNNNETTSLRECLSITKRVFRQAVAKKQIKMVAQTKDIELAIHKDDLVELLTILLDNAIKYSPTQTTITISTQVQRGLATLRVTDQGQGIAAQDLPHIFERFRRGNHQAKIRGYGLGLAVAKRIVANAGGEISAQSELGQGTTITVRLPISV